MTTSDSDFHDSLDRILSSSSTSTSDSDSDDPLLRLRFPPASLASPHLWLSAPKPVSVRRRLLLHHLGLLPHSDNNSTPESDINNTPVPDSDNSNSTPESDQLHRRRRPAMEIPRASSSDALPRRHISIARSRSDGDNPTRPPISRPPSNGDGDGDGDGSLSDDEIRRCTIRSLDNGSEFIVTDECASLREVGTGRQLTVEEFEMCVGRSPIVQELMRRQGVEQSAAEQNMSPARKSKSGGWLRSIKTVVRQRERRSSDESSEKGGRRSSSATDDSQDGGNVGVDCPPHRIKVRQYGKSQKDFSCLYLNQEIQAHNGAIWSIKFSLDGRYLATAGEDCVIHVWQVAEQDRNGEENGGRGCRLNELAVALACVEGSHLEKRRAKLSGGRKSMSSDQFMMPENVFSLLEKPSCSFRGHNGDVLDLSWSKSQYLLSSSMDKTVRLWHMSSKTCLKTFTHSDYVTCIQFNPVDDRYFISGSLDEKVRIWSIPDRQVVDWNDLHEMVTAACYTPDGQGALVGSHKGRCHLYHTTDNKLQQKSLVDLQNKKRKSSSKKITGFQFAPGSSRELLITSADSRIRVVDGSVLVHKFKGFRNTSSQMSASLTANGKYVICASEDSHVYVWRHETDSRPGRSKAAVTTTQSYEYFHCQNVTVAIPWPGNSMGRMLEAHNTRHNRQEVSNSSSVVPSHDNSHLNIDCQDHHAILVAEAGHYSDRVSATWPEEKLLLTANNDSPKNIGDRSAGCMPLQSRSAWGMVIVTAGRGGEIKMFQNFGVPVRT